MTNLVVGGSGFIGKHLMREIKADNIDLLEGKDVRAGIYGDYKIIIFLACNQANTREAYRENREMYKALDDYRKDHDPYVIYISSASVYNPTTWYALSKQLGEAYAKRFSSHTIFRLSNVYGHGDGHGAPDRFMRGENTINGSGEQVRDLIPVELVVSSILGLMDKSDIGTFNVSSGVGTSVNQMFKLWGTGKSEYGTGDCGVERSILVPGRVE